MGHIKKRFQTMLEDLFANTANRLCIQLRLFCVAAAVIAVIMTVLNCIKAEYILGLETGIGAALSVCIYLYASRTGKYLPGSLGIVTAFLFLLTLFAVSGAVEGFATLWFCLYPFICLFILDMKIAVAFTAAGFLILASLLWSPLHQLLPPVYSENFLLRFPFLYLGNSAFALALNGFYSYTYGRFQQLNRKFERLSSQDGLTKLANRTYLEKYLDRLFDLGGLTLSSLMLDIDYFKQYNDTYGHLAGDEALKTIAALILELLPEGNSLAVRYGGEEFLILLPEYDKKAAVSLAGHILDKVQELRLPHSAVGGYLSVSIGVSGRRIDTQEDFMRLLKQADDALYRAKQNGRRQVWEA